MFNGTYLLPGSGHRVVPPCETHGPSILRGLYFKPVSHYLLPGQDDIQGILTQYTPEFGIIMDMTRIQVVAQSAFEHGRILRDDGESATKVSQTNCGNIETINAKTLSVNDIGENGPSLLTQCFH